MKIVVTGATGNHGSALLRRLETADAVDEVVGIARRLPAPGDDHPAKARFVAADVRDPDLAAHFAGADAVIHLAWAIQPARDRALTRAINVEGSRNVFAAAASAGVGTLVHASSVGAYSPGPERDRVDEGWPTGGIRSSFYSADKADVESLLDQVVREHPRMRVVRLRPGIVLQPAASAEIRRLFLGPFFPASLVRPDLVPIVPDVQGVRFQVVHTEDLADAYARAALQDDAAGAFNVAVEPVIDLRSFAKLLRAVPVPVPNGVARAAAALTWRARLQPTPPGWLDLGTRAPLMSTSRARQELGWTPLRDATETLGDFLAALRRGQGADLPPLRADAGGRMRVKEVRSGLGARPGL